jgi:hypothetical protein
VSSLARRSFGRGGELVERGSQDSRSRPAVRDKSLRAVAEELPDGRAKRPMTAVPSELTSVLPMQGPRTQSGLAGPAQTTLLSTDRSAVNYPAGRTQMHSTAGDRWPT